MKQYIFPGNFQKKKEFLDYCRTVAIKDWTDELYGIGSREESLSSHDDIVEMARTDTKAKWTIEKRSIFRVSDYWEISVVTIPKKGGVTYFAWIHIDTKDFTDKILDKYGITIKPF